MQGVVVSVFIVSKNLYALINATMYWTILFDILCLVGLVYQRYRQPDLERPIKVGRYTKLGRDISSYVDIYQCKQIHNQDS